MDLFTKFNTKNIQDRQVDSLIGLSKGLIADGEVNQLEAEFLLTWLVQSRQASENPIIINLLDKVSSMLLDGVLDNEESQDLLSILRKITGEKSEIGELAKTASLPLNDPFPYVSFENKSFLFTGTFAYGNRMKCQSITETLGAKCSSGVNKSLDYLVLGTYVTDSWAHENYGRKIEKAIQYRDIDNKLVIINEEHWIESGNIQS